MKRNWRVGGLAVVAGNGRENTSQKEVPMPRTSSTVTFGEFQDAGIAVSDLEAFWKLGTGDKRKMREQVFGANHTAIWNMVQDVTNISRGGGSREMQVRMTGGLTLEKVASAMQTYVRDRAPLPEGNAPTNAAPNPGAAAGAAPAASTTGEPPRGVSPNIIEAVAALYGDQSRTFDGIALGNDFRMLLWGIAPDDLKSDAERGLIGDALGTLTRSADAAATVRLIMREAGLTDDTVLSAMRSVDPALVTAQHSKAADTLFHLSHISRELNGYEGLVRDEAVSIVRKARQRTEPSEEQVTVARNTVALDTLGLLLDNLEREAKRWAEWSENRKSQSEREATAQNGNGAAEAEAIPYADVPDAAKEKLTEEDWNSLPASAQNTLVNRWKDAAPAPEVTPEPEVSPETTPEPDAAPENNTRRRR
jgi:hypothetical protein